MIPGQEADFFDWLPPDMWGNWVVQIPGPEFFRKVPPEGEANSLSFDFKHVFRKNTDEIPVFWQIVGYSNRTGAIISPVLVYPL